MIGEEAITYEVVNDLLLTSMSSREQYRYRTIPIGNSRKIQTDGSELFHNALPTLHTEHGKPIK